MVKLMHAFSKRLRVPNDNQPSSTAAYSPQNKLMQLLQRILRDSKCAVSDSHSMPRYIDGAVATVRPSGNP